LSALSIASRLASDGSDNEPVDSLAAVVTGDPDLDYSLSAAMNLPELRQAMELFRAGNYEAAAAEFNSVSDPGLSGEIGSLAHFYRGESLARLGDWEGATVELLDSFSGRPDGSLAANALLRLGQGLDRIGQTGEACFALAELDVMFPGHPAAAEAEEVMIRLQCS